MLQPGDTFGAYRIVARLKAGGMARLYLARREGVAGFARPVALKVIHAHLARQSDFVQMFIDEARLSSKIHDPNVVHVEDLGEVDKTLFLAMEYVHGASLSRVLQAATTIKRRLTPAIASHLVAAIASGLHAAHETKDESQRPLGIVHRDVSPHNVLVSYRGHVKLIDFGVAKALRKSHDTQEGAIQGKIAYMPPEQALGADVDRRADLYALGIVLWEMIVGRRLFEAENELALLDRVRNPRVERPSTCVDNVPKALDDVTMALLQPKPEDRPATALEVKRMLLDAVPEARSLESDDVAAFLQALLAEQIEREDALLSSFVEDDAPGPSMPTLTHGSEDETLEQKKHVPGTSSTMKIEPSHALEQLTIEIHDGDGETTTHLNVGAQPVTPANARAEPTGPMRLRRRPPRKSLPLLVGLVALFGAVAVTTVLLSQQHAAVVAAPVFPPPPAIPTLEPVEAPTTSETAAALPAVAASSSSVAPVARPVGGNVRPAAMKSRPRSPAAAASRKAPRTVGGVELYED